MNGEQIVLGVLAVVASFLGGAGGGEAIKAVTGRKPRGTVAVQGQIDLAKQASEYAAQLEGDAREAQEAARQAWAAAHQAEMRVNQVSQKLDRVQYNLSIVSNYVVWVIAQIRQPDMTMTKLREQVEQHQPPTPVGMD